LRLKDEFGICDAIAFDISNACAGFFTALYVADAMLKNGSTRRAMIVSGEYLTHLIKCAQFEIEGINDPCLACLTLGDSGVAVSVELSDTDSAGFEAIDLYTLGAFSKLCVGRAASKYPGGSIMYTDSTKLLNVALGQCLKHAAEVVERHNLAFSQIDVVIPHQTAKLAIDVARRNLNDQLGVQQFLSDNFICNVEHRGNLGSNSHFVALRDSIDCGRVRSNHRVLFSIASSGFTGGTAVYKCGELPMGSLDIGGNRAMGTRGCSTRPSSETEARHCNLEVESIGTYLPDSLAFDNVVTMSTKAIEDCLRQSRYHWRDIDLLIYAGVYRNDFLCEPAVGALIAGKMENSFGPAGKIFCFDISLGQVGCLQACHLVSELISAQKHSRALVVTSESEIDLTIDSKGLADIQDSAGAMLLTSSAEPGIGFGRFYFHSYTNYLEHNISYAERQRRSWMMSLSHHYHPAYRDALLRCIGDTVRHTLANERLEIKQISAILPLQTKQLTSVDLATVLSVESDRIVRLPFEHKDLFTAALPWSFKHVLQELALPRGDILLIIQAGSGIQVGCATYRI
jgi:3-oxoacyl-[acyl-carrier-protein] synthase III